jgi:DNA-directed RNA polymerase specialized sigma subunit
MSPEQTLDAVPEQIEDQRMEEISSVLERRESEQLMRKLIQETLDETESRVMTLHYVHEMPLDSVTRLLRLTNTSGAKAHIVSARRKLARAFALWQSRESGMRGGSNV